MNGRSRLGQAVLGQAALRDILSVDRGLAGQGLRFVLSGGLVLSVYVTLTILLSDVFLVPFQIALASGFVVGVALHFTLQRLFVWKHHERFALAAGHQALRYLTVCAVQYGLTALSTSRLPGLIGLPEDAVYAMTMLVVTSLNFVVFRGKIFHPARR